MASITTQFGTGGANLAPQDAQGAPSLATALRDIAADLAVLHAAIVGITAKLDADAGVTDTDYASTLDPIALVTVQG